MPTANNYTPGPTPYVGPVISSPKTGSPYEVTGNIVIITDKSPTTVTPGVATGTTPKANTIPVPLDKSPNAVTPGVATGTTSNANTITVPVDKSPNAVTPGVATGTTSNANTITIPISSNTVVSNNSIDNLTTLPVDSNLSNISLPTTSNVFTTIVNNPGSPANSIQFNNNGTFGGAATATWLSSANGIAYNAITITTTNYSSGNGNYGRNGSIYFKDNNLTGLISGSINFKAGGRATQPGFMIAPWNLSYNNQPGRQDAGLGIWRSTQEGLYQRTQTTINGSDNGPSVHGVYIADGALDFFPDYASGNNAGLTYVVLPAAFTDGTTKRYVGQISVNAYKTPGTPQWSLGWKASDPLNPTWNSERTPGNRNIVWDSNNHVSINDATLTESLNVKGNIRIQATGANSGSGIKFADGTFQYTAATSGGGSNIAVYAGESLLTDALAELDFSGNGIQVTNTGNIVSVVVAGTQVNVLDEGTGVVLGTDSLNFVGSGVTVTNNAGVATITIPSSGTVNTVYDAGSATTVTLNYNNGQWQNYTPSGSTVDITVTNIPTGGEMTIFLQTGATNTAIAWHAVTVYFWEDGVAEPSQTSGTRDVVTIKNNGIYYFAKFGKNYSP